MACNDTNMIIGSSQLVMQPRYTEHTVSQEIIIDKKFWELTIDRPKDDGSFEGKSYFSTLVEDGFIFKRFTADDDGEVIWTARISSGETNYKVVLNVKWERKDLRVLCVCRLIYDLNKSFSKKKPQENYRELAQSNKDLYFNSTNLKEGFKNFRIDITYVKLVTQPDITVSQSTITPTTAIDQKESLISGVAALFENSIASDVTIRSDNQEWKLHKIILAAQSKTFAAMFSVDMKENNEGLVEIKDVNGTALDLMLKFLYNIKIDDTEMIKVAEDLFILSDMYDVPNLKKRSEVLLISKLRRANCLDLFALGKKYNSGQLLASAKLCITRDLSKISKTKAFKDFVKNNPDLSIEITLAAQKQLL